MKEATYFLIITILLSSSGPVFCRPQGTKYLPPSRLPTPSTYESQTRVDSHGITLGCERTQVSPGKFEYTCSGSPGIITEEKTLWIPNQPRSSGSDIVVHIPNYKYQDIIRAGLASGSLKEGTNIQLHLAKPQIESIVEGEFETRMQEKSAAPNVQISYQHLDSSTGEVHYGGSGSAYAELSKPISEPIRISKR